MAQAIAGHILVDNINDEEYDDDVRFYRFAVKQYHLEIIWRAMV